jgi:CO/xanthine dehydrogenase FAD-binding subunit
VDGAGRTVASPDELLVAVMIPIPALGSGSSYVRLQYRRQMEIAVVGAAALVTVAGGVITDARIAITALAPVIHRIPEAESLLVGQPVDPTGRSGRSGPPPRRSPRPPAPSPTCAPRPTTAGRWQP